MKTNSKAKYGVGDMVYTYQNEMFPCPIAKVEFRAFISVNEPHEHDTYAYKVTLPEDGGYTRSSKWIDEDSVSTTPLKKILTQEGKRELLEKLMVEYFGMWEDYPQNDDDYETFNDVLNRFDSGEQTLPIEFSFSLRILYDTIIKAQAEHEVEFKLSEVAGDMIRMTNVL